MTGLRISSTARLAQPVHRAAPERSARVLRVRALGSVRYRDALALQRGLHASEGQYLLLLEHPHVYTLGVRAKPEHVLVDPATLGAELVHADRGGDVTYHGPGQLVGYPILDVSMGRRAIPDYVATLEQVVIDALSMLGCPGAGRLEGYPGVWLDPSGLSPRKICAIGVRVTRGRSMHGFALNVAPDLSMFSHIVPCGIADKAVTSLKAEGIEVTMAEVIEAIVEAALASLVVGATLERQDATAPSATTSTSVAIRRVGEPPSTGPAERALYRRLRVAGVDPDDGVGISERKPEWLRVPAVMGDPYLSLKRTVRELSLVTVCEEAGCPNIFECWADRTATFMINGERCTRACGFCLVDTSHPLPLDAEEPARVAAAVQQLGLEHAVITMVARDDLEDGGAGACAETILAVRGRMPATTIEVLISDLKGRDDSLGVVFAARPDIVNHNLETVNRLQRAVRPSASYARSLSVLTRAKRAGLTTKSGMILGMGETMAEVLGALFDLRAVGVDIVTLGQYLRPTRAHLPVARWWRPEEFEELAEIGRGLGFAHVEASPLTRSSYHARAAANAANVGRGPLAKTDIQSRSQAKETRA